MEVVRKGGKRAFRLCVCDDADSAETRIRRRSTVQVVIGLHTLTTHLASIFFIAVTMSGTTVLLMSLGNVSRCDSGVVNLSILWIRKFRLRW